MSNEMNPTYYTLLTDFGKMRIAEALAGSEPLDFKIMVLGDGNGVLPKPAASQTQLVHEVWRGMVNSVSEHGTLPGHICVDCEIPADTGGFTIREVGLYDSNHNFVAIGNFPETFKPLLSEGSIRRMVIRVVLMIENMNAIAQGGQLPEYMTKEEVIEQIAKAINTQKFPPETHNHNLIEINGLSEALSEKAETVHEHTTTQISGLENALSQKAQVSHPHTITDVTGLQNALDGKSPVSHTHPWANITNKPVEYPPSSHRHSADDIHNLQEFFNAKADHAVPETLFAETTLPSEISDRNWYRYNGVLNSEFAVAGISNPWGSETPYGISINTYSFHIGTGGSVSWPSSVSWEGGSVPKTVPGTIASFTFFTRDGIHFHGNLSMTLLANTAQGGTN